MHLGNGAITPECAVLTFGAAAAGLGLAANAVRRDPLTRERLALAGGLGAMIFAAQSVNVPILPGTSAHLVGGALLAWAVGPALGSLTMGAILLVQALALGDGGLLALGANICNMALIPAASMALAKHSQESTWKPVAIAAVSVPLAALCIVGETAAFRSGAELAGWQEFAARMIGTHLGIGLAEGGLTLLLIAALARLAKPARWRPVLATVAVAILFAALIPLSSSLPDGYEAAAEQSGLSQLLAE